jgi:hypothetical protein
MSLVPGHQLVRELSTFFEDGVDAENRRIRESVARVVSSLGETVLLSGDVQSEAKLSGNRSFVGSGNHPGMRLGRDMTVIVGAPGAQVNRQVVVESESGGAVNITFSGVHFTSADETNNQEVLVDITTTRATVIFERCVFEKVANHATNAVNIASGSKAHFIGCTFVPTMTTTGSVVDNAGAAANVYIIGCSNMTGRTHNNVTTIAETT